MDWERLNANENSVLTNSYIQNVSPEVRKLTSSLRNAAAPAKAGKLKFNFYVPNVGLRPRYRVYKPP